MWIEEVKDRCELDKGGEGGGVRCIKKVKEGCDVYEGSEGGGVFIKEVKEVVWCG